MLKNVEYVMYVLLIVAAFLLAGSLVIFSIDQAFGDHIDVVVKCYDGNELVVNKTFDYGGVDQGYLYVKQDGMTTIFPPDYSCSMQEVPK